MAPDRIKIEGMEKDLSSVIENFAGNHKIKRRNNQAYREKWNEFLPTEEYDSKERKTVVNHETWSMAYIPRISIRKTHSQEAENSQYFTIVLNSSRDNRPQQKVPKGEDLLQKNVIDREMIMAGAGSFFFCPNGYPYHESASLLISKEQKQQGKVTPKDIEDLMKFSFLTDTFVFFNSFGAGASRPERFHAQVVDPQTIRYEGKPVAYPILNEKQVKKEKIETNIYQTSGYPVGSLIFKGKEAPYKVAQMIMRLEDTDMAYNMLVNGTDVYLIGRNKKKEKSDCVGKNMGGYECSGMILVGNIEEPLLGQVGLEKIIRGNEVFNELDYETISGNLEAASIPVNWLKDLL